MERSEVLQEQVRKLKGLNHRLQESVLTLTDQLEKKKKELALSQKKALSGSKRPLSATMNRSQKPEVEIVMGPNHHHPAPAPAEPIKVQRETDDTNWHDTAMKLQARLEIYTSAVLFTVCL